MSATTKTMYMHTLDGCPASAVWYLGGHAIFGVSSRTKIRLESSLKNVRRTQKWVCEHMSDIGEHQWAQPHRYGYVLVGVPR